MWIKCKQCGGNLSKDKRFVVQDQKYHDFLVCHNCRQVWEVNEPNPYSNELRGNNKNIALMVVLMLLSLFTYFTGYIGIFISFSALVYAIKTFFTNKQKILSLCCCFLCGLTFWASISITMRDNETTNSQVAKEDISNTPTPQQNTVVEVPTTETAPIVEEQPQVVQEPQETEEEYKASCQEIPYKDVLRNPENYVGQRVKIEIEISSVHEASWLNNTKYYFGSSKNETYKRYWGDDYGVYDLRDTNVESWFKILDEDVIMVYGEVAGTEHTTSLILNSEELFVIDMKYAELIAE